MAFLEAQVYHLMELLGEQRQATRDNVQRRQARTGTERADDGEEVASGINFLSFFVSITVLDTQGFQPNSNFSLLLEFVNFLTCVSEFSHM